MEMTKNKNTPTDLAGFQRKFLRARAHALQPVVWVGRDGVTPALLAEVDQALEAHELIKIKFNDHKDEKEALIALIAEQSNSVLAGVVGHVALFYRPRHDPTKRILVLPQRS
ncbi:MAG: ribosome assembly RNA-binding protein YhbY [Magnetococcus sp. YQC-5]